VGKRGGWEARSAITSFLTLRRYDAMTQRHNDFIL
jgi:hypothetical protein